MKGYGMKKGMALGCLAAMMALVPAAMAQEGTAVHMGFGAEYRDAPDLERLMGGNGLWGGSFQVRICPARYPKLGIDMRVGGLLSLKSESFPSNGAQCDLDTTFACVPAELGLVAMLPVGDVVSLYGGGGVGYYYYYCEGDFKFTWRRNRTQQVTEHFKMDGDFGWYAVGGAAFHMGPVVSFFAEIRYTDTETAFSDPGKYDLPEEGNSYDLGGFGALIGFIFKL